ncbi:hypothetical protein PHMEG_00025465 [Phytophthora megakarya]|uniref:Uncharacterized protein n=1 Tax=Phytophthora megakarya TaxID=4795 RepID=A0A225VD76_9STRA|nr:hypothetical protein PHMEG_00025465 [Phytophthora megakarya]
MNDTIVDIDSIFNTDLKVDLQQPDVKARVINYFMLCDDIISQHGFVSTFSTVTGMKEKCKILKKHLEPAALRDAVESHQRFIDGTSKSDENALYELVKAETLEQEKVFQLLAKRKKQAFPSGKSQRGTNKQHHVSAKQTESLKEGCRDSDQHRTVTATTTPKASPSKARAASTPSKPRTGCFHCGKDHWLSQCPDLDEAGKEAILAERRSKKVSIAGGNKRFRAKRIDDNSTTEEEDRPRVNLNGVLELPYCADSDRT